MRILTLKEVLELHRRVIEQSGGPAGVRDLGLVESALAQPLMTFGGEDLYPTVIEKASALCFSLINNHPFIDGKAHRPRRNGNFPCSEWSRNRRSCGRTGASDLTDRIRRNRT